MRTRSSLKTTMTLSNLDISEIRDSSVFPRGFCLLSSRCSARRLSRERIRPVFLETTKWFAVLRDWKSKTLNVLFIPFLAIIMRASSTGDQTAFVDDGALQRHS